MRKLLSSNIWLGDHFKVVCRYIGTSCADGIQVATLPRNPAATIADYFNQVLRKSILITL